IRDTTYTLMVTPTPCVRSNPGMSITPPSQLGTPGSNLSYTIAVTNKDSGPLCTRQTFTLSKECLSGWSCVLGSPSLSIDPGATSTTTINVTSPTTASLGNYQFTVTATSDTYTNSSTATYVVTCDNTSYTSCVKAYDFDSGGTKLSMCGENQYYKILIPPNKRCDLTWTLTPGSGVDYDLYTKPGSCPSTTDYECKSEYGMGVTDKCTHIGLTTGTYYALAKYYEGRGIYSISATLANCVEILPCVRDKPNVTINPLEVSKRAGESHTFNVAVTNKDRHTCGESTFELTSDCPSRWTCSFDLDRLTISPGNSTSSKLTIKSTDDASGRHLINLTVVNMADRKYNTTKSISFTVVPKCEGARIKIIDANFYKNAANITVENNGAVSNLTIVSAIIIDKVDNEYKADNLPITKFDVGDKEYVLFTKVPSCEDFSKVIITTDCPEASTSSTEVKCLGIELKLPIKIVEAKSCKDADCEVPSTTFKQGEKVYVKVKTDPEAEVSATVFYKEEVRTIDLAQPFIPREAGTYTIEVAASKKGYVETMEKLTFTVEKAAVDYTLLKVIIIIFIIACVIGYIYYRLKETGEGYKWLYKKYKR
ncbi:MAG: hypothetical protein QMD14_05530, partial [Candidatus Aenigmarchaeota archaeon]|nr:hypothetical protein [Candidatus Aenigmarchaeota archaeon]